MDLFEHRYYRLSKNLMSLLGQWPHQSVWVKRGILVLIIFAIITGLSPAILAFVKYRNDSDIVLELVISGLFVAVASMKFVGMMLNSQKTLKLFNGIFTNWQVWARDHEVNIIHEYAEQGGKITIVFTAAVYTAVIFCTSQPMVAKIIDVMLKNGTEPGKFPCPVEYYFFNAQKYYYYVMMHLYFNACLVSIPYAATDTMLIICAQHVCGVFAALGYKLERIGCNDAPVEKGETQLELNKRHFVNLASIIDRHNDAIEYANLIDEAYAWNFFFSIGFGVIFINIAGLQILTRINDTESIIRFLAVVLVQGVVFFTECYFPQIVEDHSINIGYYIYNSRWYRLSPRTQKLLQFMMMRCRIPCQITAGKIVTMSFRTFGMTVKTAMSYFAVIRSTL